MIQFSVFTSGSIDATLEQIQAKLGNLQPLGQVLAGVVVEGNRKGLMAGLDKDGSPMVSVKRQWGGPPLSPHEESSRAVTNFGAQVQVTGDGVEIVAGWSGCDWLRYHSSGTRRLPVRDIVGIRGDCWDAILQKTQEYIDGM